MNYFFRLCFILILFTGCKKNPFDYRSKFIGDYHFEIESNYWDLQNGSKDTAYSLEGNVDYGNGDHSVIISYDGRGSTELNIYEDGTLDLGGNSYRGCRGTFESANKVNFTCGYHGLGGGSSETARGQKK